MVIKLKPESPQIKKKRILQLAEESGLIFNRDRVDDFQIFPHHAQAIWDFYQLIEKEQQILKEKEGTHD